MTADPIGLVGGINPYIYAYDNPIRWVDHQGLKPYSFQATIGGGVGYVIVGGGVFSGSVSDLTTGETCSYQIRCGGLGVGLPDSTVTSKPVDYDDGRECSSCRDFEGIGYIGGASFVVGGGITIGGGIKFPNGPFVGGELFDFNYGGIRIGVSHSICYFRLVSG